MTINGYINIILWDIKFSHTPGPDISYHFMGYPIFTQTWISDSWWRISNYISIISPWWKSTLLPQSEWLLHGSFHDCCEGIKGWLALHQAEVAEPQGEAFRPRQGGKGNFAGFVWVTYSIMQEETYTQYSPTNWCEFSISLGNIRDIVHSCLQGLHPVNYQVGHLLYIIGIGLVAALLLLGIDIRTSIR